MKYIILVPILLLVFLLSCKETAQPYSCDTYCILMYDNSFESQTDIDEWEGVNVDMLTDEDAYCGNRSLRIGGGCVQPAATYQYTVDKDAFYYIIIRGKIITNNQKGMISIYNMNDSLSMKTDLTIDSMEWKTYTSDYVYLRAGEDLCLEVIIGGIIEAYMYLDCLSILRSDLEIEPI